MKNRKLLYILIPATIVIWTMVGINIFRNLKGTSDFETPGVYIPSATVDDTTQSGYELLADYRDPFLVKRYVAPAKSTPKSQVQDNRRRRTRPTSSSRNTPRVNWPNVEYKGVIMNNSREVALVRIDNSNLIMLEGEERKKVTLVKLYPDSVSLSFSGEKKTFYKK